ncbi:MAG TPA: class I SAM-dependent methyltransferase [Anaerolineaceae bacterium]
MARSDAQRWNQRYQAASDWNAKPRSFLVQHAHLLPERGLALDLAMGMGQNAAFLVKRGLQVIGLDISLTAVSAAKQRCPEIMAAVVDLEEYRLSGGQFDLLLDLYFLDRAWFPEFWKLVKPGGLLVIETLTLEMLAERPDLDPRHLLQPGELRAVFQGWEILVYREGSIHSDHGHQKAVAGLIARRPDAA